MENNQWTSNVRLVREGQAIDGERSSIELFKSLNANQDNINIGSILNDIIYIVVKDAHEAAISEESRFKIFVTTQISDLIAKYVAIYLATKDRNVLVLLYSILLDTFLSNNERKDPKLKRFIVNIYNNVMDLIPN